MKLIYNELRKDYLLDRWVVIATERGRRPSDFAKKRKTPATADICPMCLGNEHMTPPAVLVYLKDSNQIVKAHDMEGLRQKNWLIRCVPNLYPAFSPPQMESDQTHIMQRYDFGYSVGHHEVMIESPNHNEHIADAELPQLMHLLNAYLDRLSDLASKPYVRYVSIFRNHGLEAGASLSHAHSQLIATPFVPTMVENETAASRDWWRQNDKCVFCDIIQREKKGPRLILDTECFVVISPYASVHPMEFWILPKKHAANMLNLSFTEKKNFAKTLRASLKALKDLVNDPPYNFGFHLSLNSEHENCYHWHLEVYPRLAIWAGFEKNTGMYINTVTPETAAAELKKALAT